MGLVGRQLRKPLLYFRASKPAQWNHEYWSGRRQPGGKQRKGQAHLMKAQASL